MILLPVNRRANTSMVYSGHRISGLNWLREMAGYWGIIVNFAYFESTSNARAFFDFVKLMVFQRTHFPLPFTSHTTIT
ncbi:hypothetical protein WH47_11362 [Habropoda laboriosa]|uniref:Uncharacterized protein n=1 Tax=Habropoda laboriosa TaxID=597456 RepID=A0A0L7QLY6_9HYME|nr:hypothetical protein WH47_11362 [Habropoda laboriosa]